MINIARKILLIAFKFGVKVGNSHQGELTLYRGKFALKAYQDIYNLSLYKKYNTAEIEKGIFFNVGAGSFHHPYWKNIDYVSD